MAFGGFNKGGHTAPMAEINTTPLVDVMLVLLVVFIITAPMLAQSIKIELPKTQASAAQESLKPIVIGIAATGQYEYNGKMLSLIQLKSQLQQAAQKNTDTPVHIKADKAVPYDAVAQAMAAAQAAQLAKIGFITEAP